jgi:3-methyladenine DNA glycosylase AlkD
MKRYVRAGNINETLWIISRWPDDLDNWASVDPLAIYCVGRLLVRDLRIEETLSHWRTSSSFRRRRAGILPFVLLCRKQFYKEEYSSMLLDIVKPHLPDREIFIQRAIGWLLRELSQRNPRGVRSFIRENRDVMTKFVADEALRKTGFMDTR